MWTTYASSYQNVVIEEPLVYYLVLQNFMYFLDMFRYL